MERDRRPNGGERSLCYRTTKPRISHLRKPEPVAKEGVSQTGIPLQDVARVSFGMTPRPEADSPQYSPCFWDLRRRATTVGGGAFSNSGGK